MRIIITGSNGFLGKELVKVLSKDHIIIHINRRDSFIDDSLRLEVDLADESLIQQLIVEDKIGHADILINTSAKTASPGSINDLSLLFENAKISKSVSDIAKKAGVSKVVNISSMSVYPNIDGNYKETDLVDPSPNNDCIYGLSKFNSEVLIDFYLKKHVETICHLRLAMLEGEGLRPDGLVSVMKQEMFSSHSITIFGNGERLLNIIDITQAASYVSHFVDNDIKGIYNVGDQCLSIESLATRIAGQSKTKIIKVGTGNNNKFKLDISKVNALVSNNEIKNI